MELAQLGAQAGYLLVIIVMVAITSGLIGYAVYLRKKNKLYNKYKVIVWKRHKTNDGEMPILEDLYERGAIRKDKAMNKWSFHLKNANLDLGEEEMDNFDENRLLDIPSVPYSKGGDIVFIEKLGNHKYAFGEPFILEGKVHIKVSEADLAEAKRSYALFVKTFGKKESPLVAFLIYVTFAVLILVLIFVVLNKFEVIVEASKNFMAAADTLRGGSAMPSGAPG